LNSSSKTGAGDAPRILVVDDDPAILKLLGAVLEQDGVLCTIAESSEAALLCLDAELYRMLIVDKNLPGLDGIQLARIVHMLSPDLPILLITGYASSESAREAAAIGVKGYIRKPIDVDEFRRSVQENLRRSSLSFTRAQWRFGSTFPPGTLPVVLARLSSRTMADDEDGDAIDLDLLRGHSVLVVEQDEEDRAALSAILDVPECRVDAFGSLADAADHVERSGYDLLVGTPEVLAASGDLAERSPRPVLGNIAIMERDDLDSIVEAIEFGARGLIAPPFAASKVFHEISRVMRGVADERLARSNPSDAPP
jgi:DNA-binding NtrC family response regulator